ncbi:S26 family signal peptidase [Natrialba sp. INN-245]|uniref:S26 family signal peptidase n=1 Tax=Natrialba sp. INN-245 TaxID=2690967 RepID=UPI001312C531|nr:S26 family signal peptidase [Natrialba sp. INN-245]MWV41826.1 S26 family signal peptidase [Natrialba sp. INN-245]
MSGPHSGDPGGDSDDGDSGWNSRDSTRNDDRPEESDDDAVANESAVADASTENATSDVTIEDDGIVRWFLGTEDGTVVFVRDILSSVAIVAVIALILFGISGIWPPLVAVESGSMEPNMERGDLVFVVDDDRFVGDEAVDGTGVVTLENGENGDHEKFGQAGDVVVFKPDGSDHRTPIIHRAHFWVDEGENWVDTKAENEYVGDATCAEVPTCPAPHDGFVTKGDANSGYDQYRGGAQTDVVSPDWVTGKAMIRVPWLGHVRLFFDSLFGAMVGPVPHGAGSGLVSSLLDGSTAAHVGVGAVVASGYGLARRR